MQNSGNVILRKRGFGAVGSLAVSICNHVRFLYNGTAKVNLIYCKLI